MNIWIRTFVHIVPVSRLMTPTVTLKERTAYKIAFCSYRYFKFYLPIMINDRMSPIVNISEELLMNAEKS